MAVDVLDDVAALLAEAGVEPGRIRRAVAAARLRWGGSQCYVRATDRAARDDAIQRGLDEGRPVPEVARRAGVSPSTVRRRRARWLG